MSDSTKKTKSEQVATLLSQICEITGWGVAMPKGTDGVSGFIVGTEEYINEVLDDRPARRAKRKPRIYN